MGGVGRRLTWGVIASAAGCLLAASPASATVGGPTCNVPTDYATIAAALADGGCSTINVAAGLYLEGDLQVTRAVTINGPNAGIPTTQHRGPAAEIESGGDEFVLNAGSGAVTLNGLDVIAGGSAIHGNAGDVVVKDDVLTASGDFGVELGDVGGATITGNSITASSEGVYVISPSDRVKVVGNWITGSPVTTGVDVPAPASAGAVIDGNAISGAFIGIDTGGSAGLFKVAFNSLGSDANSIVNGGTGKLSATNNWLGCNAGPSGSGCAPTSGKVDSNPWLVLRLSSAADQLDRGQKTKVKATLLKNSDGQTPTPNLFPDGTPIHFATTRGEVSPADPKTKAGVATTTFKATQIGKAHITATLDSQTKTTVITVR